MFLLCFCNSALEFGAAVRKIYILFPNFVFSFVLGETLLPKYAYRPWDHFSVFVKKTSDCKSHVTLMLGNLSRLCFLFMS